MPRRWDRPSLARIAPFVAFSPSVMDVRQMSFSYSRTVPHLLVSVLPLWQSIHLSWTSPPQPPVSHPLLPTVRILVVLHLVLHFCYQSFGPAVFQNIYLRRFAEWGAVQYSTLLCLEGMVLAIRYGRSRGGRKDGEDDEEESEAPEATSFFKRHALEVGTLWGGGGKGGKD